MNATHERSTERAGEQRERPKGLAFALALGLALLTLAAYSGAQTLGFVSLDDPQYVVTNPIVLRGLTSDGLRYAFTTTDLGNWHPLTWLSHMAVAQLAVAAPAPHHEVNVALHLACVVILFAFLTQTTRAPWPAALAAGLFAVHPLHVESVAWVAERKDVLSTLFWLLAMLAHARWAATGRRACWWGTIAAMALGLMSKPMLVTLPLALLLLDFWPLRRFGRVSASRLVLEKLPLFALAVAASAVTLWAQAAEGAMKAIERPSLGLRLANAVRSCGVYLLQTVWPVDLAVFYPYPDSIPASDVALAALALVALSAGAWLAVRRAPWLTMGWLWFLVTLLPVLGLVQVGAQAHADRYVYVPHIGLFAALAYGIERLAARGPVARFSNVAMSLAALGACTVLTRAQVSLWRNDHVLFEHSIEAAGGSPVAHDALGRALQAEGKLGPAMEQYRAAIRLRPSYASAWVNLGTALDGSGDAAGALACFETATQAAPELVEAWVNLGSALGRSQRPAEAAAALDRALALDPDHPGALLNSALNDFLRGERPRAAAHFRRAVAVDPALRDDDQALVFAWMLATDSDAAARDGELAGGIALAALERRGARDVQALEILAAAEAERGRFDAAIERALAALAAAESSGLEQDAARLRAELELYRAGRPMRTP
jgi:protein O-mannosyl-transferase